jgi:cold shock CspA family protein
MADNTNIEMSANTNTEEVSDVRYTGTVKWFNNKNGYGFITVCDGCGDYSKTDIFVHYTSIRNFKEEYKYLLQGEYVEFSLAPASAKSAKLHAHQAMNVTGVRGGPIMCETRRHPRVREDRPHAEGESDLSSPPPSHSASRRPRSSTRTGDHRPRGSYHEGGESTTVRRSQTDEDGFQVQRRRRAPTARRTVA